MAKLPKIYQNTIHKEIHNNRKVYYSNHNEIEQKVLDPVVYESFYDIENLIDEIFSQPTYSFNIGLLIHTKDKTYDTSLIAKTRNSVITFDNDVIPIREITSIEKKS